MILLERVNNLGDLGDEVSVKAGFARNFLLPKKKAVQANDANRAVFEERRKELEDAANEKLAEAKARAEALNQFLLTIQVKAGEEDRLFGSVGTQDIADALVSKGLEVERSEVRLPDGAIRVLGEYEVDIQVHSDVTATIHLHVLTE